MLAAPLAAPPPVALPRDADLLERRLLGDPPAADATATPASGGIGAGLAGLWPLGLAVAGVGLVWLARKKTPGLGVTGTEGPWVVGRSALTTGTQALLLEVRDATGRKRRLLVATGSGALTLLADLGEDDEVPEEAPIRPPRPKVRLDRRATARSAAPRTAGPPTKRAREAAMSLIDEVVSTRKAPEVPASVARDRYAAGSR
ncbi:MAG: flagellar biosynthetic protein FliO [Myxococcota bacterium]